MVGAEGGGAGGIVTVGDLLSSVSTGKGVLSQILQIPSIGEDSYRSRLSLLMDIVFPLLEQMEPDKLLPDAMLEIASILAREGLSHLARDVAVAAINSSRYSNIHLFFWPWPMTERLAKTTIWGSGGDLTDYKVFFNSVHPTGCESVTGWRIVASGKEAIAYRLLEPEPGGSPVDVDIDAVVESEGVLSELERYEFMTIPQVSLNLFDQTIDNVVRLLNNGRIGLAVLALFTSGHFSWSLLKAGLDRPVVIVDPVGTERVESIVVIDARDAGIEARGFKLLSIRYEDGRRAEYLYTYRRSKNTVTLVVTPLPCDARSGNTG